MEPTQQSLVFNHSAASIAVSVAFIVAVVVLAFVAARRAAFRPAVCALETLRVLIAAAIAITLNQPEWLEQFMPNARPAILVLRDVSGSMTTADVPNPDGGTEGLTRTAAAEALANPEKWEPLKKDFDVHSTTFSSTLTNPAEGTDINEALSKALDDHPQLKGVVLLSDGDWNTGNASQYPSDLHQNFLTSSSQASTCPPSPSPENRSASRSPSRARSPATKISFSK
jgi:hypothetical protein